MKRYSLLLLSFGMITCLSGEARGAVMLNEIMINPDGSDTSAEWVELFGTPGDDIGGWVITDGDQNNSVTIPTGTMIPADGLYLVGNSTKNGLMPDLDTDGTYDGSTAIPEISLTNGGEFVGLFNAVGSLVDGLIWTITDDASNNGPNGQMITPFGGSVFTIGEEDVDMPNSPWNWIDDGSGVDRASRMVDGSGAWEANATITPGLSNTTIVPEPSSVLLLMLGIGFAISRRSR